MKTGPAAQMLSAPAKAYLLEHGPNLHNFTLTRDLCKSTDRQDVFATCRDMASLGLFKLPYPAIWLSFRPDDLWDNNTFNTTYDDGLRISATMHVIVVDEFSIGPGGAPETSILQPIYVDRDDGVQFALDHRDPDEAVRMGSMEACRLCLQAASILVATLACRNVVQSTATNKRAARGLGNGVFRAPLPKTIYLSVTSVSPPSFATGTGVSPRPHMRRGHKHTFLCGEGRTETIERWVAPIFVNSRFSTTPTPAAQHYEVA